MAETHETGAIRRAPLNSPTNAKLRRVEVAAFCGLVVALAGAMVFRAVQFLTDGFVCMPVTGISIPWPAGIVAAALLLALSAAITLAALAMFLRFIR